MNAATTPPEHYADAEAYLSAVVEGRTPPHQVRVMAARVLIAYQRARQRMPLGAERTPRQAARAEEIAAQDARRQEFEAKAASIKRRRGRSG